MVPSVAIASAGREDLVLKLVANFCVQLAPPSVDSVTTSPSSPESIVAPGAVP